MISIQRGQYMPVVEKISKSNLLTAKSKFLKFYVLHKFQNSNIEGVLKSYERSNNEKKQNCMYAAGCLSGVK